MILQDTPTTIRLEGYTDAQLKSMRRALTFKKSSAVYAYQKFKNNRWAAKNMTREEYYSKLEKLKAAQETCLLFEDDNGYWTYSGLIPFLREKFKEKEIVSTVEYPAPFLRPWTGEIPYPLRPYQREIVDALIEAKHGGVDCATGLGKSLIIQYLIRELGHQAVVVAPTKSIAEQLYQDLVSSFGKAVVGFFGDGKKQYKKDIVVAITHSVTRMEEGSPAYEKLSQAKIFIFDESHLAPADTFERICHGIMKDAPYRFFMSGTQIRNDGADLLLQAITGPIVYRMSVRKGVDDGWLAKPEFRMIKVQTSDRYVVKDVQKMIRHHFLYNPKVNSIAATMANHAVEHLGHQVVILIDEVEQFAMLYPNLSFEVKFAHGGLTSASKMKVPAPFHDSDPQRLVDEFNEGKFPILVGTSCISTGTDIRTVQTIISLQGGKSEIKFRQSIGRGTRKPPSLPEKDSFYFIDFDVRNTNLPENLDTIHRHAQLRAQIYNDVYGPVESMEM